MEQQPPLADIPLGFFEYRATFKEPIFAAWIGRVPLIDGLYKVLLPWGINLEKVTLTPNPRNLQEAQITFTVPNPPAILNIGIGGVLFSASNADWSQAPSYVSLFQTVLDHLKTSLPTEIEPQQAVIGFHVKPGPTPFREIMKRFINTEELGSGDTTMYGVGAYGTDYSLLMDASAAVPGGIFVKITRVFLPATHFEEMAAILWKDEESIVHRLGFRTQ